MVAATSVAAIPSPRTAWTAKAAATAQVSPVSRLPALLTAKPASSSPPAGGVRGTAGVVPRSVGGVRGTGD